MSQYQQYADSIVFKQERSAIVVASHHPDLIVRGVGRSAAAFRIKDSTLVIKVFFPEFVSIAAEEAAIYAILTGSTYYPVLHDHGSNYIVIDFVRGKTMFQCLTEGIPIKPRYVQDVDRALSEARARGLTPSDVHLRNIIITENDEIKLIDLARFRQLKEDDSQWDDLKNAYSVYEKWYFPKKIPEFWLNRMAAVYKRFPSFFHSLAKKRSIRSS